MGGPETVQIPLAMLVVFGSAKVMAEIFERLRQPDEPGDVSVGTLHPMSSTRGGR